MTAMGADKAKKIIIVGSPNVGKSVLFNNLTGQHATVSNYPGTTVEILKGKARIGGDSFEVIDTPGMYSFSSLSEEEAIARRIIFEERDALLVHVVDAKNLDRMLPLTLQILEANLRVVLVLNMMDEARRLGFHFNRRSLQEQLGISVVETVLTKSEGMDEVKHMISSAFRQGPGQRSHSEVSFLGNARHVIEPAVGRVVDLLRGDYRISKRTVAILLLSDDEEILARVGEKESPNDIEEMKREISTLREKWKSPVEYERAVSFRAVTDRMTNEVIQSPDQARKTPPLWRRFGEILDRMTTQPLTGILILGLILYWGFFQFVGVFGAGTVVDFLEEDIFVGHLNPFFVWAAETFIPWGVARDLFVGEYGVLTLGLRYALSLILPIVTFYFLVFSVIEDTGYLPRLAMLIDRIFKMFGLSGRAVIPTVLGFGCVTMATMVTRTLPTKRERFIATLLLALAIPCSAQLGVILALLSGNIFGLLIWGTVIGFIFVAVGTLVNRMLPGEPASFYMELPPLRFPKISNVFFKTYVRVKWYFIEILPFFIYASVMIWFGKLIGLFDVVIRWMEAPVSWIGLPPEAAFSFLMGFFRRDYGAAGLYDLAQAGVLDGVQIVIACVALTLFIPCIAQFLINIKERGWGAGVLISIFTVVVSFSTAFVLNAFLRYVGIVL